MLKIKKTRKLDIDQETYYKIISDKTASMLETCCQIGAMSASDNLDYLNGMKIFGENIGMAFQITDDVLDLNGKSSVIGKPVGGDIKEKKITLPLIYSLNNVSKSEANKIRKIIKKGKSSEDILKVVDFVRANNGIEFALEKANQFSEVAKKALKIFPDSPSKIALESLVDFVISRKN